MKILGDSFLENAECVVQMDLIGDMKGKTAQVLAYVLFLAFGLGLTVWIFARQDLDAIWDLLRETRWGWVGLSLLLTLGGHWLRAVRWRQLTEGVRVRSSTGTGAYMVALMNGYLVNLGVPRLGELTRCLSLNRLSGVSVLRAGGTVVVERLVDMACLGLVLVAAFWMAGAELADFFREEIFVPLRGKLVGREWLLVGAGLVAVSGLVGIFLFLRLRSQNRITIFLQKQAREFKSGMFGLLSLPHKGRFLLYTLLIWASYFSAPLLTLFALGLNGPDVLEVGFVAFAVGSIARTVPAPAGSMGPYHWLVMHALLLFGFTETEGLAVATLNHAVQTAFYLLAGAFSFLIWAWMGRKRL